MVTKLSRAAIWFTLWILVHLRAVRILAWLYSRFVEERMEDGTLRCANPFPDERPTLFVLSAPRYRGEPEQLAATGKIRILQLPEHWVTRLLYQFYPRALNSSELSRFMNPQTSDPVAACKQSFRRFLRELLPLLYGRYGVNCVVGHSVHIAADVDWGPVSDELGYHYLVFHREGLLATPFVQNMVRNRLKPLGQFEGRYVVLQNQATIDVMIASGFVEANKVRKLGAVRMDGFLNQIEQAPRLASDRKQRQVLYFTKVLGANLEKDGLTPWFNEVHVALARLASENPDITVIMKMKPGNSALKWHRAVQAAFDEVGIRAEELPNLVMTSEGNANEMILASDVVCSLQSVTLLEAGVAGRPVVVPYFGWITDSRFDDRVYFLDNFDLFDTPRDAEDFIRLIKYRLENQEIDTAIMRQRRNLFETYVASLDGKATEEYVDFIEQTVCNSSATANTPAMVATH
jgi:hypothetical protein